MLNCHDATFLMSQACDRRLGFSERAKLRLHLTMCRACANFRHQLPQLGSAARIYAEKTRDLPDD